jgi:hypothetical protein
MFEKDNEIDARALFDDEGGREMGHVTQSGQFRAFDVSDSLHLDRAELQDMQWEGGR